MKININEIQRFCTHDGPGIRTTVFMSGCPLSCKWCHNPESKFSDNKIFFTESKCVNCKICEKFDCKAHIFKENKHIFNRKKCFGCGECANQCPSKALENTLLETEIDDIFEEIIKDKVFYGETGGVTLSGGEPFAQADAAFELLKKCKDNKINTAIETCGFFDSTYIEKFSSVVDLLLWDIKDTNENRHIKNIGASLNTILENLFAADKAEIKIRLRCVILKGINGNSEHIKEINEISKKIRNLQGIDLIPYHPYGESKYKRLGITDTFDSPKYIPSDSLIKALKKQLYTKSF